MDHTTTKTIKSLLKNTQWFAKYPISTNVSAIYGQHFSIPWSHGQKSLQTDSPIAVPTISQRIG